MSESVSLSSIKSTLVTGKFVTIILATFISDNNRSAMRTNDLVTDADFKDVYSLQY